MRIKSQWLSVKAPKRIPEKPSQIKADVRRNIRGPRRHRAVFGGGMSPESPPRGRGFTIHQPPDVEEDALGKNQEKPPDTGRLPGCGWRTGAGVEWSFRAADGVWLFSALRRTSKPIKPGGRVNGSEPAITINSPRSGSPLGPEHMHRPASGPFLLVYLRLLV